MRDILVALIVFGILPFCIMRPSIGVLLYSWIGYMNPHRLAFGFAYNFPFAQLAALVTLIGLIVGKDEKKFPWCGTVALLIIFILWMCITTAFSINTDIATTSLEKIIKIQVMIFITLLIMNDRQKIVSLIWVIAMSMAYFGVKGGIFGILTGGRERVWGPSGSFIAGNNEMGLALVMTLPLLWFLYQNSENKYIRWGMLAVIGLTAIATLATQSRGAFLGICAMAFFLWLKSNHKAFLGISLLIVAPILFVSMPESWHERMGTIKTYDEDESAMSRIVAWEFAVIVANKSVTGTGAGVLAQDEAHWHFAPDFFADLLARGGAARAAHSIYFGILGQHGWIGLFLFLSIWVAGWLNGQWVLKNTRESKELEWCRNLASMLQVSLIGYAVSGAFLSLEYFDYYYHLIAVLVLLKFYVKEHINKVEDPEQKPVTNNKKISGYA